MFIFVAMKTKYPKSWHLPYSEKPTSGDRKHSTDDHFHGKQVVVTIKMDGENTSIYNDGVHARSLDSHANTEDRRWVDALRTSKVMGNLPDTHRVCGENMFYKHTCEYNNLDTLFYVFSIWDQNTCLSWKETEDWCKKLGLKHVPIIYKGVYNKDLILNKFKEYQDNSNNDVEGFVVRMSNSFSIDDFNMNLNKYVCKSFQIGDDHWRHSAKTINGLKDDGNPWEVIWK